MPSVLDAIAGRNAAQQRRVIENRQGETIEVAEGSGLLVTGCRGCTIRASGRSSGVTIERCDGGTTVEVGSVVASLEVIHCTDVQVSVERWVRRERHGYCRQEPRFGWVLPYLFFFFTVFLLFFLFLLDLVMILYHIMSHHILSHYIVSYIPGIIVRCC